MTSVGATKGCNALSLDKHSTLGSITGLRGADKHDWLHVGYLFKISHIVNSAFVCNSQEMLTVWKASCLSLTLAENIKMGKLAYPRHYSVWLHMWGCACQMTIFLTISSLSNVPGSTAPALNTYAHTHMGWERSYLNQSSIISLARKQLWVSTDGSNMKQKSEKHMD